MPGFTDTLVPLKAAIIGCGLGGLSAAIALRRQGHNVTLYERYDFANEVGASLSCASNGSRFLEAWDVDIKAARPVVLKNLISHEWGTGEVTGVYSLGDYKKSFGSDYNNFHRIDLHNELLRTAQSPLGKGPQCQVRLNHKAIEIDSERGYIKFENGQETTADLVIAADGIRSLSRVMIGVIPSVTPSTSCCYRCIIGATKLRELGLEDYLTNNAIEFWGGYGINKIVISPCADENVVSCYCFYPASHNNLREDGWNISATPQQLVDTFPDLDPRVQKLFLNSHDIRMWRLYMHEPYSYMHKGVVVLLGDAAHPMLPDQSQGACQAIEDAGCLGILFSQQYLERFSVPELLALYELERKPRVTRIQEASVRAREDLKERIGWSTGTEREGKLTIEEVCGYDMATHMNGLAADFEKARRAAV